MHGSRWYNQKNNEYFAVQVEKIKLLLLATFLLITAFWGYQIAFSQTGSPAELNFLSPVMCPSSGCAAGQRLNFQLSFSVNPKTTLQTNTLICITTTADGNSDTGVQAWADYSNGYISNVGLSSGLPYIIGDQSAVCTSLNKPTESLLTSVYTTHPTSTDDQLNLALRIAKDANLDGFIKLYVYEYNLSESQWDLSDSSALDILVKPITTTAFVADAASLCSTLSPCFINSGDDLPGGIGTGLKDAIDALTPTSTIRILSEYNIKSEQVLIDKYQTIEGFSSGTITYSGLACTKPMLSITNGATIRNLEINDGLCSGTSRDLLVIDSATPVIIERNTFQNGNIAITIEDNTGDVLIRFNHIIQNLNYAIKRSSGTSTSKMTLVANNIIDNNYNYQVDCQSKGVVDHNYWGTDLNPQNSVVNCSFKPGKHLGAAILTSDRGVEAELVNVTTTKKYLFSDKIAVKHDVGADYNLYVVNHGNGSADNVPFIDQGTEAITACNNFYDVFLAEGALPSDLLLSFKYDLNSSCVSVIESADYCGQTNAALYPLWWYDPAYNVTDKWDRVGESPKGSGASGATGQATTCNLDNNEISVSIDSSGRPNFVDDLYYTPFIVGIPLPYGVQLINFTADFSSPDVELNWVTSRENQVSGFHVLRSDTQSGTYYRISSLIPAVGNAYIGGIYAFTDKNVSFTKNYYYKLEVVDTNGMTLETYGPLSVFTATATPTVTLTHTPTNTRTQTPFYTKTNTRTPYVYRTNTPYVYRSPTPIYRTNTPIIFRSATPINRSATPTQQTGTVIATAPGVSTSTPTLRSTAESTEVLYPIVSETVVFVTGTPLIDQTQEPPDIQETTEFEYIAGKTPLDKTSRYDKIQWYAFVLGSFSGLLALGLIGYFIYKSKIS